MAEKGLPFSSHLSSVRYSKVVNHDCVAFLPAIEDEIFSYGVVYVFHVLLGHDRAVAVERREAQVVRLDETAEPRQKEEANVGEVKEERLGSSAVMTHVRRHHLHVENLR